MEKSLRAGLVVAPLVLALAGLGASAATASTPNAAPKPHIVGTWANQVNLNSNGGYTVWSNGRVQAFNGAPYYGGATSRHVNNIVGIVGDVYAKGYWLVASNGAIYGLGRPCPRGHLIRPRGVPSRGIVGGINRRKANSGFEGLALVSRTGKTYAFACSRTG